MCDNELLMKACRPLPAGTPPLAGHDLEHLLGHAEGWEIVESQLEKTVQFENHYQTLAFVNAVAWISHREDHHPEMVVGYNTCTVRYATHSIGGLSENDFICAAKVNALIGD
ncbi:MAG: 4a-hydroxytetrahydrobiopterin dehydratase [Acidobacteria bacterium]|jgi:4a-hydroxytetrahydrobiopterin dehydratase|nr:4a-hydroxytetrahydrobiopterin dehydratase [Acidobacteriota bacterium]